MALFNHDTNPDDNPKEDRKKHGFLDGVASKKERIISDVIPEPDHVRMKDTKIPGNAPEEDGGFGFLKRIRGYSEARKKGAAEKAREAREETRQINLRQFVRSAPEPVMREKDEVVRVEHISKISHAREFTPKVIPTIRGRQKEAQHEETFVEEDVLVLQHRHQKKEETPPEKIAGVYGAAKNFQPEFGRRNIRMRLIVAGGAVLVLVAGFFVLSSVLSSASVVLRLKVVNAPIEPFVVSADVKTTAINITAKKLPGLYVETKKTISKNFEPKTKTYAESRAHGRITIYNEYSYSPQTLVAKTRFETKSSGLVFRLEKQVIVPGAKKNGTALVPSSIDVEVVADGVGENYNIDPAEFTIPGLKGTPRFEKIYAKSTDKFSGGFKGDGFIAGDAEIKTAEEAATAQVFEEAKADLMTKLPPGFIMVPGAREIRITRVSKPRSGEAGTAFSVTADATAGMLVFKKEDMITLLSTLFLKPEKNEEILTDKSDISYTKADFDFDSRQLSYTLSGSLITAAHVDPEDVKKSLTGLSTANAEEFLKSRAEELIGFALDVKPFWARSLPSKPEKIKV
ncbi:MAG: hypothetical protein HYW88_02915, partial [Candidatus Sungbacteria bacterium]|nr:hypothetical protein [Candidatus Sungbacteria bacterium]